MSPLDALPLVRRGPPVGSVGAATVLLHGRNRDPNDMLDLAERVALPGMPFVAIPAHAGTWYPESFLAPLARNEPHLGWALARVESVVCELEREGAARGRIAIVGFSQGACLACEYVFRTPTRWGAVAALTGGLIGPPETEWVPTGALAGTPLLLATSDVDAWVPLDRVAATEKVFRSMGGAVDFRVFAGREHLVSDDEVVLTRALLAPLLSA
jgi:phospholipase/carboxylesterase